MSVELPESVTVVPRKLRVITVVIAVLVVAIFAVIAVILKSTASGTEFHTSDQVAMAGIGLLLGIGIATIGRPRITADREGIVVRNYFAPKVVPWADVESIIFPKRAFWARLQLRNDEAIALLALQAMDNQRAVVAMRNLRALHAAATSATNGASS